jgi:hypothetical protein
MEKKRGRKGCRSRPTSTPTLTAHHIPLGLHPIPSQPRQTLPTDTLRKLTDTPQTRLRVFAILDDGANIVLDRRLSLDL